ncbi:putative reverse transcriptase [Clonorchis sinensis]|uniref:Putative reverse transcriptase n=1 Tax=Clonorchis sinensis TaxID=79923 RepID=G7YJF5_CLOSI|nr:putative reverse transcriptase [Clonorchis sinensis]
MDGKFNSSVTVESKKYKPQRNTDFDRTNQNPSIVFVNRQSVPTSTQERFVGLKCEECGKWCKSKAGLVAHHRVHDNDSVGTNMVAQLACADCSRLFPTKIGLSQHRRHAHPTQHNADKLSRVKHSGARWSQQESQSLLRLANNLYPSCETQTALFARLEQYFPGRSAISIKTRLRVLNWQAQQDESSSGGPDQTIGQIAAYSSEADDYSVWFKQTVDCAVSLLESHADSSLASVDLLAFARGLQSGIMTPEQKTVSRRRRQLAHRMPVNRKQIRRANYAAIQTLYHLNNMGDLPILYKRIVPMLIDALTSCYSNPISEASKPSFTIDAPKQSPVELKQSVISTFSCILQHSSPREYTEFLESWSTEFVKQCKCTEFFSHTFKIRWQVHTSTKKPLMQARVIRPQVRLDRNSGVGNITEYQPYKEQNGVASKYLRVHEARISTIHRTAFCADCVRMFKVQKRRSDNLSVVATTIEVNLSVRDERMSLLKPTETKLFGLVPQPLAAMESLKEMSAYFQQSDLDDLVLQGILEAYNMNSRQIKLPDNQLCQLSCRGPPPHNCAVELHCGSPKLSMGLLLNVHAWSRLAIKLHQSNSQAQRIPNKHASLIVQNADKLNQTIRNVTIIGHHNLIAGWLKRSELIVTALTSLCSLVRQISQDALSNRVVPFLLETITSLPMEDPKSPNVYSELSGRDFSQNYNILPNICDVWKEITSSRPMIMEPNLITKHIFPSILTHLLDSDLNLTQFRTVISTLYALLGVLDIAVCGPENNTDNTQYRTIPAVTIDAPGGSDYGDDTSEIGSEYEPNQRNRSPTAWQLDCKCFITNRGDIISAGLSAELPIFHNIADIFGRSTLETARRWETFACRLASTRQQLRFLHECLRQNALPRSVSYRPPLNHPEAWKLARENGRRMIRLMITDAHIRLRKYARVLNEQRETCLRTVGPEIIEQLSEARRVRHTVEKKRATLERKLYRLVKPTEPTNNEAWIMNLSRRQLTAAEENVLIKGLNFNFKDAGNPEYLASLEAAFTSSGLNEETHGEHASSARTITLELGYDKPESYSMAMTNAALYREAYTENELICNKASTPVLGRVEQARTVHLVMDIVSSVAVAWKN